MVAKKTIPQKGFPVIKIWRTIGKFFTQQGSTTNTTMASMTQEAAAGMTALKPSSRKQRRDLIRGVKRVTTDPNDLIQSDNEEEEELVPRKMDAKQGWKHAYGNPPSLPSTIQVGKSSDSQQTSSVPGLSSLMDMSMTEISEENQISMIKTCMKKNTCSLFGSSIKKTFILISVKMRKHFVALS